MLTFNNLGHLTPNTPIKASISDLKNEFVINYSSVERSLIFESYLKYNDDLKKICGDNDVHQWVDGSFVTKSNLRPKDIDLVTFIDNKLIENLGDLILRFIYPNSKLNYPGVDGYIIPILIEDSINHNTFQSDKLYWHSVFDTTRRNKQGKKLPKGFLEIIY